MAQKPRLNLTVSNEAREFMEAVMQEVGAKSFSELLETMKDWYKQSPKESPESRPDVLGKSLTS